MSADGSSTFTTEEVMTYLESHGNPDTKHELMKHGASGWHCLA